MIKNIILFLLGIVLLLSGSNYFVKHVSIIAKKIGVSEFIIGLTLVSIGTSLPELISSIVASTKNQSEIILGNIVGANIANLGLSGGLIALLTVAKTKNEIKKRDVLIMVFSSIIFYILISDGVLNIIEGLAFLLLYVLYIIFLLDVKSDKKGKKDFEYFVDNFLRFNHIKSTIKRLKQKKVLKRKFYETKMMGNLLIILFSGVAIYFGAQFLISQTIFFGDSLGISKTIIGLSVIALGTTLPELSISISAARKGLSDIAIGNIIGSNITNIFLVLGISSIINNIIVDKLTLYYSGIFMLFMSLIFWFLMRTDYKLRKKEGIILLILYVLFIISLVLVR